MTGEQQKKNLANELARERSREAADRTLMAWVRTTLSLIGFGFGIANFRDILFRAGSSAPSSGICQRGPGVRVKFYFLGVLGLLSAVIQHWNILQHLKQDDFEYTGFRPLVFIMAILLMIIGFFAFVAVLVY